MENFLVIFKTSQSDSVIFDNMDTKRWLVFVELILLKSYHDSGLRPCSQLKHNFQTDYCIQIFEYKNYLNFLIPGNVGGRNFQLSFLTNLSSLLIPVHNSTPHA